MTGKAGEIRVLKPQDLQALVEVLSRQGYEAVGPTRRHDTLVYEKLSSVNDLPVGWTSRSQNGGFRLGKRKDAAWFGYGLGQESWKKFLYPPSLRLWEARRDPEGWRFLEPAHEVPRFAFVGVRACDLAAMAVQDKVFLSGRYVDPTYQARRREAFILAVNCTEVHGTCFCASVGTGPKVASGFDLALTETLDEGRHYFVAEVGSPRGAQVLAAVPTRPALAAELKAADRRLAQAARHMDRNLDTTGLKDLLYRSYEHPHWDEVAARCLTCGNCAMVCPTCFCHTIEDNTDLTGVYTERRRRWDVCFSQDFSYIHGGSVRVSPKSRYRQWLTHKLATWQDQFGTLGCVGCGRCIAWCPVGIDITEEVQSLRAGA